MKFIPGKLLCLAALTVALSGGHSARADFVRLSIDSEPGNFVGAGQQLTLEYDNDLGSRLQVFSSEGSIRWVLDDAVGVSFNTFSTVNFRTDTVGVPLQAGTFLGATRAAFADPGEPGLDVSFQNRGSNQVFGEFTINSVDFFQPGNVPIVGRIDVSFEQRSESPNNPALFGNIFYQHSDFVVPEPTGLWIIASATALFGLNRRRSQR